MVFVAQYEFTDDVTITPLLLNLHFVVCCFWYRHSSLGQIMTWKPFVTFPFSCQIRQRNTNVSCSLPISPNSVGQPTSSKYGMHSMAY